jgi:predicted membrane protein
MLFKYWGAVLCVLLINLIFTFFTRKVQKDVRKDTQNQAFLTPSCMLGVNMLWSLFSAIFADFGQNKKRFS